MTSLSLTENEVLRILLTGPSSFEAIVSKLSSIRKLRRVGPGSRSTTSLALKSLYQKRFVDYDVVTRQWRVTSLGRWSIGKGLVPSEPASALSQVTQPLLNTVEDHPEKLVKLLSMMFVYSLKRSDKFSAEEERLLKDTESRITLFVKGYPAAIEAIWGDAIELLVGNFSSLMAAVLLHRSSLDLSYRAQASATIPKIVEQSYKPLVAELGEFLSKYLADPDNLAILERRLKDDRERLRSRQEN
jgi:hypothetical protein